MSKADNMLAILWLLKSGKKKTAQQLADELEIHIRTVYRCIDSLCASGVPIVADSGHNGGYSLLNNLLDAPLFFNLDEQKALIHAATFAKESGYPFAESVESAVIKLKRYTNEDQLERIERHQEGLAVLNLPHQPNQLSLLRLLEEAAANSQTVKMEYKKEKEYSPSTRNVDPYGIVYWKGSWFVIGFCHLRKETRSFRVERIVRLDLVEAFFERPIRFSSREFLLNSLIPGYDEESSTDVIITGEERVLDELCKHWLFGHTLVNRVDGQAHFIISLDALKTYAPYFLLPYGKAITIKQPLSLVEKMVEVTSAMAEYYGAMTQDKKTVKDVKYETNRTVR